MPSTFKLNSTFSSRNRYTLYQGDCMDLLKKIGDSTVDLTVTSPPYCIGKEYESTSDVEDFTTFHQLLLPEVVRITKPGGSICWQVGYHVKARSVVPLDFLVYDICRKIPDLKLRNRIVWTFGHGLHETERFTGRHETILWFTKGDDYSFDLDAVRVPQKYPGKKSYRGPNKGNYSGNPNGKNPSDVWEIPNVKANHKEKTGHPCQFPLALVKRLISSLTSKDALVFDPFSGAGTTGAASVALGRRFVGAELDGDYWKIAAARMKLAAEGELPCREPDLPIFDPTRAGAVGRKPEHFLWNEPAQESYLIES
jgi:adenine-specific DNA-methyltransferase